MVKNSSIYMCVRALTINKQSETLTPCVCFEAFIQCRVQIDTRELSHEASLATRYATDDRAGVITIRNPEESRKKIDRE